MREALAIVEAVLRKDRESAKTVFDQALMGLVNDMVVERRKQIGHAFLMPPKVVTAEDNETISLSGAVAYRDSLRGTRH